MTATRSTPTLVETAALRRPAVTASREDLNEGQVGRRVVMMATKWTPTAA